MNRWRFFDTQESGDPVAFDLESLRFFRLGPIAAKILKLANEGTEARDISAQLGISPSQALSVTRHARYSSRPAPKPDSSPHTLAKLSLHVAHICNLRCRYCYAQGGDYGQGPSMMSQDVARSAVDTVVERFGGVETIQFFGGEPLLNWPAILSVCEYLDSSACDLSSMPHTGIVSNLVYYPEELEKLVNRYGIWVTVSLDGPAPVNDANRVFPDGRGSYSTVAANIRRLRQHTSEPRTVEATYTRTHASQGWTKDDLRRFFAEELGIKSALIAPVWDPDNPTLDVCIQPLLCQRGEYLAPRG